MKKAISVLMAFAVCLLLAACSAPDTKETTAPGSKDTSATAKQTAVMEVPYMKTDDWNDYTYTKSGEKELLSFSITLPAGYKTENTILYDAKGNKCAEAVGAVLYQDGQKAFDNIELNTDYNGISYKERGSGTIGSYSYKSLMGEAPTEDGAWNVYAYALDCTDFALLITLYSYDNLNPLPDLYKEMLGSIQIEK